MRPSARTHAALAFSARDLSRWALRRIAHSAGVLACGFALRVPDQG